MTEFKTILAEILAFRDERDWKQFHTPKNLAAALAIEAAELQEVMLWKTDTEVEKLISTDATRVTFANEVADILIYALLFANEIGIDPQTAIRAKLILNSTNYPSDRARGNATKYTDLDRS